MFEVVFLTGYMGLLSAIALIGAFMLSRVHCPTSIVIQINADRVDVIEEDSDEDQDDDEEEEKKADEPEEEEEDTTEEDEAALPPPVTQG